MKKVFISYKRDVEPDESLALQLYEALREHCNVFIDKKMPVGTAWAERIQAELETCDYLIPLLSEHSVHSEMIEAEIYTAHRLGKAGAGKPRILPVRVAYTEPFEYPLSAYLGRLNWAIWESEAHTEPLVRELLTAIAGGELSIPGDAKSEIVRALGAWLRKYRFAIIALVVTVLVMGLLIALGPWLVSNAEDILSAWLFGTPSVTPIVSPTHTSVISTATSVPPTDTATANDTPSPTTTPTSTATDTPGPTATPTSTATHMPSPTATPTSTATYTPSPPTPTPVPTAVPQPAGGPIILTIYLRDTLTETGFAALSGDQVNAGEIYEEGKFVYGEAAVQIGDTVYHFDKPEVEPGEPEQLPDPWRVEFEFAEELRARTGNQAGFNPKQAQFWVGALDGNSAVGEDKPYGVIIKLYEGNEVRRSIQVFFTVADAPGPGGGPGGKPTPPP